MIFHHTLLHQVCRYCLALILFTTPVYTYGQNADEDLREYTAGEVSVTGRRLDLPNESTVAGKVPMPLQSTPASVSVVQRSQFEDQGYTELGDALRNVSGANVQSNFGVHDFFVMRGFESLTGGLIVTDGVSDPEGSFYSLYNVERVEVLKGPGAFLYGGNPLAGTVSLSRKQPIFSRFLRMNGAFGQFGTARGTVDLSLANADAGTAFRLNALAQRSDSYRDDKNNIAWAINPAFLWKPTDTSQLNMNLEYADSRFKSDSGLPLLNNAMPDVKRTRSYQAPFDISDQETFRFRMDYQVKLTPDITLRNKTYYTDFTWDSKGTLFNGAMPTTPGDAELFRSLLLLDDRQKVLGNQTEAIMTFATGSVRHTLLAGFEANRWTDNFTLDVAALPNISLRNPVETAVEPLYNIPGQSTAADARTLVYAPYIVDRIELSQHYELFLGGRFDAIDYTDPLTATDRDYRKLSPMAGFVWSPTSTLSLYTSAGGAFAAPSSRVVGAAKAEESAQYEAGIKKQMLDGRLQANTALFWLGKDNIGIPTSNGFTAHIGDQRSRGLELEVMARPLNAWTTFISYALLDAELHRFAEQVYIPTPTGVIPQVLDHSGNTPAFAPKHLFNLWTSWRWRNGFGFGTGMRYVSSQYIAENNAYKMSGAATCDAALFYTQGPWHLRLNMRNVTNTRYGTRGFGALSVIPAQPFSAYATIEYSL